MTRDELRKQFEDWAEESYGGDATKFFVRCAAPFKDDYRHADVHQAWKAAEYFCKLGRSERKSLTEPRVEAGDRAQNAELKRQLSKYDCQTCNDKGFVRINGTDRVAPCPKCNEDGMDGISG